MAENISNLNGIEINYCTKIDSIKVVEAKTEGDKKTSKKAVLSLTLMDNSINKNGYRLKDSEHENIVKSHNGTPLKMQHSKDDWDIIGTNTEASANDGVIMSTTEVTDPKAIEKFETGTWNVKNMGVSPGIIVSDIVCSICGGSVMGLGQFDHKHQQLKEYNGEVCFYDMIGVKHYETSLTSDPAYAPSAGKINEITITASLDKAIEESKKTFEKVDTMVDDTQVNIAESAAMKEKLKIEAELQEMKEKELNASKQATEDAKKATAEALETIESQKKEIDTIKASLSGYVKEQRTAEVEKLGLTDKTLTAEILEKEMTNEEFEAEISKIEKIMASVKVPTGSAPTDVNSSTQTSTDEDICMKEFGMSSDDMVAQITGVKKE